MKIIVKCENCGNEVEIKSVTRGNVAYFAQDLRDNDFYIFDTEIDKELLQDKVTDVDDVDTKLKEIRIDCRKCGNYICLDCE
jgi:DNA-directed RNA polymerase subunit M/transcription elongation factor TFIIS